jgi:hypothetical protein
MIKVMRQVINVNDIMVFFNKKERQSYKMIAEIKKYYNKKAFQPITIKEFADYYDIPHETIITVMQSNDLVKIEKTEAEKQKKKLKEDQNRSEEEAKKQQQLAKLEAKEKEKQRFTSNSPPNITTK